MTDSPRSVAARLVLIVVLLASVTLADDFKTIDGKEYKNATVSSVEPDGIVLTSKSGISKVYFVELPKEVQQRFHYDPAQAAQFTTAQQAAVAESNAGIAVQQQEETQERQHRAETAARVQQQVEEQQRQADAIVVQQQHRQLEAQQKQAAKIAAQKQGWERQQRRRRADARAIQEDMDRHDALQSIQNQIGVIESYRMEKPLDEDAERRLRDLKEQERILLNH